MFKGSEQEPIKEEEEVHLKDGEDRPGPYFADKDEHPGPSSRPTVELVVNASQNAGGHTGTHGL